MFINVKWIHLRGGNSVKPFCSTFKEKNFQPDEKTLASKGRPHFRKELEVQPSKYEVANAAAL